jgi:branched-chain amino acid transport system substrate-binding protein
VRRAVPALAVLALLAGCGGGGSSSTRITSDTLTIYTGLPLRGPRGDEGRAVLRGEKLALHEAGGHVNNLELGLVALDDTDGSTGEWAPGQVAANAREAAQNPTTIAYIGDLDSGASAVSIPITNETGILQVSPLSEYTGLTQAADKGEPDKYYPSGQRSFARLVPTSALEARALAGWIKAQGLDSVSLAYDGLQEGLGQGVELERALHDAGIQVTDIVRVDPHDGIDDVRGDATDLVRDKTAGIVFAGATVPAALTLMRAVHARDPGDKLFATDGVATQAFAAGLQDAERQVYVTSPLLPLSARPPAAARLAGRYRELFRAPMPAAALYGYEAMRSVLDAIRRAGGDDNDRKAVISAYMGTDVRDSPLGAFTIDPGGDTSSTTFGAFRVQNGQLRFERRLNAGVG